MKRKIMIICALLAALMITSASAFGWSEEFGGNVTPGPKGNLAAPKVTATTLGRTVISLKWKPVKGADGYVIYRGTEMFEGTEFGPTTYKRVKTLYGGSKTYFKNTGLKKDSEYYYEVFAFQNKNGRKVYGKTAYATAVSGVLKPYIGAYAASKDNAGVYVRSDLADKVAVYRSKTEDGEYTKVFECSQAESSWLDADTRFSETYYYKAKAYKKVNGKTYSSAWSDTEKVQVYSPYLDIKVTDMNKIGEKTDTFIYKLTSDQYNYPAAIYKQGKHEDGTEFCYTYLGERKTETSRWETKVPVVLESWSEDGYLWHSMEETYLLDSGKSVYLKFKAADKVKYLNKSLVALDIGYGSTGGRVDAGCIYIDSETGSGHYSYDY